LTYRSEIGTLTAKDKRRLESLKISPLRSVMSNTSRPKQKWRHQERARMFSIDEKLQECRTNW